MKALSATATPQTTGDVRGSTTDYNSADTGSERRPYMYCLYPGAANYSQCPTTQTTPRHPTCDEPLGTLTDRTTSLVRNAPQRSGFALLCSTIARGSGLLRGLAWMWIAYNYAFVL